jgi:hypothetical protein
MPTETDQKAEQWRDRMRGIFWGCGAIIERRGKGEAANLMGARQGTVSEQPETKRGEW